MGFWKRITGWFAKDDDHDHDSKDDNHDQPSGQPLPTNFRVRDTGIPRRGFSVPVQVVQDRPQLGPILTPSVSGDGGVQVRSSCLLYPPTLIHFDFITFKSNWGIIDLPVI